MILPFFIYKEMDYNDNISHRQRDLLLLLLVVVVEVVVVTISNIIS